MPSLNARLSRLSAPTYTLKIDGLPATVALTDRVLSLTVILNNGKRSDQLTLNLDDRPTSSGGGIILPRQGVTLRVSMGYEAYLAEMGSFQVNQVSLSGSSGGHGLTVTGTPSLLQGEKTRTWSDKTIDEIVKIIAKENALDAAISSFKNKKIPVINQLNESDGTFLTHLAARYNAVCKPMAGRLLFMQKGQGTSATGKSMDPVPIKAHDILQWNMQFNERQPYTKVVASWIDLRKAEDGMACHPPGKASDRDILRRLPHPYSTKEEAEAAAEAEFDEFNRGDKTLKLTVIGDPDITAEGTFTLSGVRNNVDGTYVVESATHSFSSSGYETSIQAYVEPG